MYLKNLNALYIDMQKNGADSVVFAAHWQWLPALKNTMTLINVIFVVGIGTLPENLFERRTATKVCCTFLLKKSKCVKN